MKYVLIILFLLILAIMTVLGYNKGFVKTLVSMTAILLALALMYFLGPKVQEWLDEHTELRSSAAERVLEKFEETFAEKGAVTDSQRSEAMRDSWVPDFVLDKIDEQADAADALACSYEQHAANYIAGLVVSAAGSVITLVAAFVLLKAIQLVSGILNKLPVLGGVNRIFGALLGFARGLLILWIVCGLITAFAYTEFGEGLLAAVSESKVLSLFYDGALSFGEIFK